MDAEYFKAVSAGAPPELAASLYTLPASLVPVVDTIIRLVTSSPHPSDASAGVQAAWSASQQKISSALADLKASGATPAAKRAREDDAAPASQKKPKTADTDADDQTDDPPLFTLHALSLTAPIRKKADITVHRHTLRLTHPATHAPEHAPIPLSAVRRAFLLPTRGKTKPHWSVLLLPSDTPAAGKAAKDAPADAPQVAFGLDAAPAAFSTTSYDGGTPAPTVYPKGAPALPALQAFLAHLPVPALEPAGAFRSAGGAGGVEAYRGAKNATLWFLDGGALWDGRPAEFWTLGALAPGEEGAAGVRVLSATGRTCSVILRRLVEAADGEQEAVDTDFGMVDGKEQDPIQQWVRKRRNRLGKQDVVEANGAVNGEDKGKGKAAAAAAAEDDSDDPEDEDFSIDSDSDGGSPTEDSESEDGGGADDGEGEAEASDEDAEGDAEGEDEDEDLDPANHPLLRPGAMPKRISKAAMDMVVGMVEQDLVGGSSARVAADEGSEEDEEDQLED